MRITSEREAHFRVVVSEHSPAIRRICRAYLYDTSAVDDLCQEILLSLWQNFHRFEGRAKWSTYVYRVAVNTAISYNRRHRRIVTLDTVADHPAETGDSVEVKLAYEQRIDRLQRAIQTLPEIDRLIVSLLLEELSYQDIAEITGLTISHVGVRISRAKAKLYKLMQT